MTENIEILFLKASDAGNDYDEWIQTFQTLLTHAMQSILHYTPQIAFYNNSGSNQAKVALAFLPPQENANLLAQLQTFANKNTPIINIIQSPINSATYDTLAQNNEHYQFFDFDPSINLLRKFENKPQTEVGRLFWSKMIDLSFALSLQINAKTIIEPKQNKLKTTIYLADTTHDQYENHDVIKRELLQRGFNVVPIQNITNNIAEITDNLNKANLSIHIIGNNYGKNIAGKTQSIIDIQQQIAGNKCIENATLGNANFQRLIWLSPDTNPNNDVHKTFIEKLKKDDTTPYSEVIQTPITDFISQIIQKINNANEPDNNLNISTNGQYKTVYLICENPHTDKAKQIHNHLINCNINVITTNQTSATDNLVSHHRNNLVTADAVIILDTTTHEHWVISKLKDLLKAPGYGKTQPFLSIVVITPHLEKISYYAANEAYIKIRPESDLIKSLEPLVNKLKK